MKRQVAIFIETDLAQAELNYSRLELFNDEKITVNSTIQNVTDISKIFTDFSQSFTIPCTPTNNAIFNYFYQNDLDATIDFQKRFNAFIEIDTVLFRRGKIQLEKTNLKNGIPDSYSVTFYGAGVSLKDLFSEDKLSQLDYTPLNHSYTNQEVYNRVTIDSTVTDYDVRYPLITSKRIWQYAGLKPLPDANTPDWYNYPTDNSTNLNHNLGRIFHTELFPAVRVKNIFDLIQTKYGITFNGLFLTSDMFKKAFLYFKNKLTFSFVSNPANITFAATGSIVYTIPIPSTPVPTNPVPNPLTAFNTINETFNTIYVTPQLGGSSDPQVYGSVIHDLKITCTATLPLVSNCWLDVYKNGVFLQSFTVSYLFGGTFNLNNLPQTPSNNVFYTFKLRSASAQTLTFSFEYTLRYTYWGIQIVWPEWLTYKAVTTWNTNNVTITSFTDLGALAPDMKVSDFVSGICKEFNLTLYSKTKNVFTIEPLNEWYSNGLIRDITKYTDIQSIEIERIKLYKSIEFKYQDSECMLNKYFLESPTNVDAHGYGNAKIVEDFDGGEYKIESPFENLLHNNFGNNLQVGYCLNKELSPYVPKPCLLYMNQKTTFTSGHIHWNALANITAYVPFGQDSNILTTQGLIPLTLNFGEEISSFYNVNNPNTLYSLYYQKYLRNLYNPKNRLVKVKTILPISLLTQLLLNDRLVIKDKRYLINEMQSDLTTGEVNFTLISDFEEL